MSLTEFELGVEEPEVVELAEGALVVHHGHLVVLLGAVHRLVRGARVSDVANSFVDLAFDGASWLQLQFCKSYGQRSDKGISSVVNVFDAKAGHFDLNRALIMFMHLHVMISDEFGLNISVKISET